MFTRPLSRRQFLGEASLVAGALVLSPGFGRGSGALDSDHPLAELEVELDGDLLLPSDPRYGELRRVASFNPLTDKHPAAIARCASEADVARSVVFARERGLEIAVRSGGHDILGASVCDGGLMIDLSAMKTTQVDPRARVLRCGPGLRAGEVDRATQPFGLAAPLGCNPVVGISGLTLGGGIGWFAGKHGATCDNLIRAEIVGADGQIRRASRDEHPDLFWALQGGGGNFGIVSSLEYRLHPVAGERVIGPLRRLVPLADTVELVDYARLTDRPGAVFALQSMGLLGALEMFARSFGAPPAYSHWRGGSLPNLDDAAIDDFEAAIAGAPRKWSIGIGHYMHGAICRRPGKETPLLRPPGRFTFYLQRRLVGAARGGRRQVVGRYLMAKAREARCSRRLRQLPERRLAWSGASGLWEHYARLARIKRVHDPDNVFHLNRNIVPAS